MKKRCGVVILPLVVVMSLVLSTTSIAFGIEKDGFELGGSKNYTITNDKGEVLYFNNGNTGGTMRVISVSEKTNTFGISLPASKYFTFVNNGKARTNIRCDNAFAGAHIVSINDDSVKITKSSNGLGLGASVFLSGTDMTYYVHMSINNYEHSLTIEGSKASAVSMTTQDYGATVDNVTGNISIETFDTATVEKETYSVYALGGPIVIGNLNKKTAAISGAVTLNPKWYPHVRVLHVRKMTDPNKLLVYWGKVKKADGYIVYRFDPQTKKYRQIAYLKGRGNRAYVDTKTEAGKSYAYKVAYYTIKKNGNKKIAKKSYKVTGITEHAAIENVYSISLNRDRLSGKKGKSAKLTATLVTAKGKAALSSSVSWHSMSKKIATVSKNGKVTFKKKGTTYIYAKAHDGMNSRKVKVTVK